MTTRRKMGAAAAAATLAAGAAIYVAQLPSPVPPWPALTVAVTQPPPHAKYQACWVPAPEAVYKSEVRGAYPDPNGWAAEPAVQWDLIRIRIDCASAPCCVDLEEYRPDPAFWQVWMVADSYAVDSTPMTSQPVLVDLGTLGVYPRTTTTTTTTMWPMTTLESATTSTSSSSTTFSTSTTVVPEVSTTVTVPVTTTTLGSSGCH